MSYFRTAMLMSAEMDRQGWLEPAPAEMRGWAGRRKKETRHEPRPGLRHGARHTEQGAVVATDHPTPHRRLWRSRARAAGVCAGAPVRDDGGHHPGAPGGTDDRE